MVYGGEVLLILDAEHGNPDHDIPTHNRPVLGQQRVEGPHEQLFVHDDFLIRNEFLKFLLYFVLFPILPLVKTYLLAVGHNGLVRLSVLSVQHLFLCHHFSEARRNQSQ